MRYSEAPILTIHQPFASNIIDGAKDVENRTWPTNYRGPLGIHASVKQPRNRLMHGDLPRGVLLGFVTLHDIVTDSPSAWAIPGSRHWLLRDPIRLPEPVPMRGSQGLWRLSAELRKRVEEVLASSGL